MSIKNELKTIRIIYLAIAVGMMVLFAIAYLMVRHTGALTFLTPVQLQNLESGIILLSFVGIPASFFYHKKRMKHLSQENSASELIQKYKSSFLLKLIIMEGLGVLSLIGFMLSANGTFLIIFAIFMVVIIVNYPSKTRIADDIQISENELFN